jgi:putative membrane protein insertion efficiency factor
VGRSLALPLVWIVRLYQRLVSPLRPQTCRFYPSCSAYAVESLERFGPVKGLWLAARRLGRCHPWTPGGVDPVPLSWAERNSWRPEDYRPPLTSSARRRALARHINLTIRHDCRSVASGHPTRRLTTED